MTRFNLPGDQMLSIQEATLAVLAKDKKKILEVGSWVGQSTAVLAREAQKIGGMVYVVDWWKGNIGTDLHGIADSTDVYQIFEDNMKELGLFDFIKIYRMDSREAYKEFEDNFFDFIYIDADHRYSGMSQDIKNYYPKLKIGGTFAGHDFESMDYEEKYIENDYVNNKHNGVIKAVTEVFPNVECINLMWIGTTDKQE